MIDLQICDSNQDEVLIRLIKSHVIPTLPVNRDHFTMAEVGVLAGITAKRIVDAIPQVIYWGIDSYPDPRYTELRQQCIDTFEGEYRFHLIEKPSNEAWAEFSNESISILFLDADHSYESVKEDLGNWWQKVGKVFVGHDYFNMNGVKQAVDEFASCNNLMLGLVPENNVWYFIK